MNGKTMLNGVPYFSDTQVIELTRAEYDALPNSKYTDGVLYCIKDEGTMKGDTFSPIIYSLAEREVGVWVDGKPLYSQTLPFTTPTQAQANTEVVVLTIAGSNLVRYMDFMFACNSSNHWYKAGQLDRDGWSYVTTRCVNGEIRVKMKTGSGTVNYTAYCSQQAYVTLYYTKTTDNPGTGKWTTSGVPAHHYSTEEQVIGTWVDGKPIYEKTIIDNTSHSGGSINIAHNISNIDEVTNITGVFSFGTGTWYYPISFADDPNTGNTNSVFKFCGINKVTNTILLYAGSNYGGTVSITKIRITIQYTKTTD